MAEQETPQPKMMTLAQAQDAFDALDAKRDQQLTEADNAHKAARKAIYRWYYANRASLRAYLKVLVTQEPPK